MTLAEFKQAIPKFSTKSHGELIKLFGWYLHVHKQMQTFRQLDVKKCYETLHMTPPGSFGPYFKTLVDRKDLIAIKGTQPAYKLENRVRETLDAHHGQRAVVVQITQMLRDSI